MNGTKGMRGTFLLGVIALLAIGCGKHEPAPSQAGGNTGGASEGSGEYVYVSNEDSRRPWTDHDGVEVVKLEDRAIAKVQA